MKQLLSILFAFVAFNLFATTPENVAPEGNVFNDNLSAMEQEFSGINALEQEVTNRQVTYSDLASENSSLINAVEANQDLGASLLGAKGDDAALGIPGFWWGCVLGLLGVLVVYLVVDDRAKKEQTKKALIGCLVGGAIYVLLYLILVAGVFASAASVQ